MPVLEYTGGPNPFRNIESFVAKAKRRFPGITELGIQKLIKDMVLSHDRIIPNSYITFFGRDILTDTPETLPIWDILPRSHKERILAHPHDTGEKVDGENAKVSQLELVGRLDRRSVNRSVLISPRGLEHTYCWSKRTDFKQDVTQKDADLLLSNNYTKRLLHNVDLYGPVGPVRSYQGGATIIDSHKARNMGDVEALKRHYSRKPSFSGADLKKGN